MLFKKESCCNHETEQSQEKIEEKGIYVLGSGCSKCNSLEDNVRKALNSLGLHEEIKHIRDFSIIASYGVMTTPALVIDNRVLSCGKVLTEDKCIELIKKSREL